MAAIEQSIKVGNYIFESAADGLAAAGTTQATAFSLGTASVGNEINRITTATAGSATGIMLPPAAPGMSLVIINHSGTNIQVYGQPGDTVDDAATATGVTQMKNSWVIFACATAGAWYTEGLASGFQALFGGAFSTQSFAGPLTAGTTHTAAGGTQITANQVLFGTVGTSSDAATLPPAKAGMQIVVMNNGASALTVWAATGALGGTTGGDTVNGASTTAANIAAGSTAPTVFYCFADGAWWTK